MAMTDLHLFSVAGVETSSTTLSYMLYVLALHPNVLARLRKEIDPLMTAGEGGRDDIIPDITVLNKLEYLNAFMKEGECNPLRLHLTLQGTYPKASINEQLFACTDLFLLLCLELSLRTWRVVSF